jgi:cytochrome c oxidase subunit IV
MTSDHAADIDRHVRVYITVFVALMVLTIITVAISRVHLPIAMAVTVALLVATVKGSLARSSSSHTPLVATGGIEASLIGAS